MSSAQRTSVVPVILAGGSGSRLWPLSRASFPKQFLDLEGDLDDARTLFQDSALRVDRLREDGIEVTAPCVVTNEAHRFMVVDQLQAIGLEPARIILEPVGRNTAPALTLAALFAMAGEGASEPADPVLVVTPADHAISDRLACTAALRQAVRQASSSSIVVLGVAPNRPDTGYGYIRVSGEANHEGVSGVAGFEEKPDLVTAERYLASGGFWWNSGIFVLRASVWLKALQQFRPDIAEACRAVAGTSTTDASFLRFDAAAFAAVPAESIDYAVMEPASCAGSGFDLKMVPLEAGWSDLGAWDAVWQSGAHDVNGNAVRGDAVVRNSRNTLVHATSRLVGVIGLDDVTIVETADAVLVAHRSASSAVKELASALSLAGRSEATEHRRVHRPWGWYESVDQGPRFQVKRIVVKPGARLSLQMHHHRAEHWVVVSGTAEVTNGDAITLLSENQSTYIPLGQLHRLANPGKVPLEIIEVQSGAYLGEDDIVRYEDSYGRH